MTLALHASRDVAAAVTGETQPLGLAPGARGDLDGARELVGISPWAVDQEVQAQ